jgi:hypothetical protein
VRIVDDEKYPKKLSNEQQVKKVSMFCHECNYEKTTHTLKQLTVVHQLGIATSLQINFRLESRLPIPETSLQSILHSVLMIMDSLLHKLDRLVVRNGQPIFSDSGEMMK